MNVRKVDLLQETRVNQTNSSTETSKGHSAVLQESQKKNSERQEEEASKLNAARSATIGAHISILEQEKQVDNDIHAECSKQAAIYLRNNNQYDNADKILVRALQLAPHRLDLVIERKHCFFERFERLGKDLQLVKNCSPDSPIAQYVIAGQQISYNKLPEADELIRLLATLSKNNEEANEHMYRIRIKQLVNLGFQPKESLTALLQSKYKTVPEALDYLCAKTYDSHRAENKNEGACGPSVGTTSKQVISKRSHLLTEKEDEESNLNKTCHAATFKAAHTATHEHEKQVDIDIQVECLKQAAIYLRNNNDYDSADEKIVRALQLAPNRHDLIYERNQCSFEKRKRLGKDSEIAKNCSPDSPIVQYVIAGQQISYNKLPEADELLRLLATLSKNYEEANVHMYRIRIKQLVNLGFQPNEALTALLQSKYKTVPEALDYLGAEVEDTHVEENKNEVTCGPSVGTTSKQDKRKNSRVLTEKVITGKKSCVDHTNSSTTTSIGHSSVLQESRKKNSERKEDKESNLNTTRCAATVKGAHTASRGQEKQIDIDIHVECLKQAAIYLRNNNHHDSADKKIMRALQLAPNRNDLLYERNQCAFKKLERLSKDSQIATKCAPNSIIAQYTTVGNLISYNKLPEADDLFRILATLNENNEDANVHMFKIRIKQLEKLGFQPNEALTALLQSKYKTVHEALDYLCAEVKDTNEEDDINEENEEEGACGPSEGTISKHVISKNSYLLTDPTNHLQCCSLYIGNLRRDITKIELYNLFERFGTIFSIQFTSGQPCHAFVNFENWRSASQAMEALQGSKWIISVHPLTVQYPISMIKKCLKNYEEFVRKLNVDQQQNPHSQQENPFGDN